MKNHSLNILHKNDILELLDMFRIDDIEASLVLIFLEKKGINPANIRSQLIKNKIQQYTKNCVNSISRILEEKNINLNLKTVERAFELLLEERDRKLGGMFYTPDFIVRYINDEVIRKDPGFKVCDPACGSGAFLVEATIKIAGENRKSIIETIENNIYGVDINERSTERTKLILSLLALTMGEDKKSISFNIKTGNSLDNKLIERLFETKKIGGFDGVIGNPPYVRIQNLNDQRETIQRSWDTASSGNIDLFIPFFELGLQIINDHGKVGFITPNSYFSTKAGEKLRSLLIRNKSINKILDFDSLQIFRDVTTYTCITFLDKRSDRNEFLYQRITKEEKLKTLNNTKFKQIEFFQVKPEKWIMLGKRERLLINKIEQVGLPLHEIARISTGIATLADRVYIHVPKRELGGFLEIEWEGQKYLIEKDITKEIIKANTLKSESDIRNNARVIIWPYKQMGSKYVIIPENELRKKFPKCYVYLVNRKNILLNRDKGNTDYPAWYAFGRTQGLESSFGKKLLIPAMASKPTFVVCNKPETTFYSGYAIFYNGDLELLKKILSSGVMKFYIETTSKVYRGGYFSYAKNYIKNFSIPLLSEEKQNYIKYCENEEEINKFIEQKYFSNPISQPRI